MDTVVENYQAVIQSASSVITEAKITGVLTFAIGVGIGFVFLWWAARKGLKIFKGAFMRGKLRI